MISFKKGCPVLYSGDLANDPWTGCGVVSLKDETIVPLVDSESPIATNDSITFWPFLRGDGSVRYYYAYRVIFKGVFLGMREIPSGY